MAPRMLSALVCTGVSSNAIVFAAEEGKRKSEERKYCIDEFFVQFVAKKPKRNESAVVTLDDHNGPSTHGVVYKMHGESVWYSDSYGNMAPLVELVE